MNEWPILSTVTFLPLVGAVMVMLIRGEDGAARRNIYWVALWTTLLTFAVAVLVWANFNASQPTFQMVESGNWLGSSIGYKMGVDGISVLFVLLTALIMPACIIASELTIRNRFKAYI